MSTQRKAALISFIVSILVLALKVYAFTQTHSAAILSDALETTVNVLTACVALLVLKYALAPADQEHPYGHGKMEYFSAAFEGGVILFAALAIVFESTRSLFRAHEVHHVNEGMIYILIATAINGVVGVYLLQTGKKNRSETLKASGAHLLADVKTTFGVLLGLFIYKLTNWAWIDSTMGILVGLWLLIESYQIIKKNMAGLLDAVDVEGIKELCERMNRHLESPIIDIHHLRVIRAGNFHHVDAHVVVPEYYDIKTVHELTGRYEKNVMKDCSFDGEFAFHIDPCSQKYCAECAVEKCPIRQSEFKQRINLDYKHVIGDPKYKING